MSGYAQITLLCHSCSTVFNDKACIHASLHVPDRPIFVPPDQSQLCSILDYHTIISTIAGLTKVCPYVSISGNKSAHQLLSCSHFAYFSLCHLYWNAQDFSPLSVMRCQRCLQISWVKNIGSGFESSGVAFRLARFFFKFCNCNIFTFGGWLCLYMACVLRQLWDSCWHAPQNTFFGLKVTYCVGGKPISYI